MTTPNKKYRERTPRNLSFGSLIFRFIFGIRGILSRNERTLIFCFKRFTSACAFVKYRISSFTISFVIVVNIWIIEDKLLRTKSPTKIKKRIIKEKSLEKEAFMRARKWKFDCILAIDRESIVSYYIGHFNERLIINIILLQVLLEQ